LLDSCLGKSLILISHHLAAMDCMDSIMVLDRGEVVERGHHAELLARQGLFTRMWTAQHPLLVE